MANIPIRTIRMRLRFKAHLSAELERELARLEALLASPETIQRLLKAAAAETLLKAYRTRFLANFADALNMQRATKASSTPADTKAVKRAKEAVDTLAQELSDAQLSGTTTGALEQKLNKAEGRLIEAYDKHFGGSDLSTGMFRPLALQVLGLLTSLGNVGESAKGGAVSLGIGHVPTLDNIKTPSATPFLTGKQTASSMNVLWRHLEFGTGIYATKARSGGMTKTNSGGWWYGPRPGRGILLKGSKGVHALFNGSGVPYEADALRFETVFATMLTQALHG